MVPEGWEKTKLGKLVEINSGVAPSLLSLSDTGRYPYVKVEDMNNCNKYQTLSRTYTDDEGKKVGAGAILFPKRGAAIMNNKVRVAATDLYLDSNMMALLPNEGVSSEFLFYSLIREKLYRIADTSTIPQINNKHINPYPFLLPPLPEQKKIAQILSTWDQAITATERLLENSQQRKKGLMQQLLTGKKRLPGFEGEWEDAHLKDIASISKGKALSSRDLEDGTFPVVAGGKTSPYTHKSYTHDHAITVSASGAYAGYVAYHEYKFWASDCSVVTAQKNSDTEFLFHVLTWNQKRIYSLQSGGAQPHVYPKDLYTLRIQVPTKPEQQAIADVITAAGREMDQLRLRLDLLKKEKKALMQQLLTGKRRVNVETEAA